MQPYTFVLIGRSGCGKGTQARLLEQYISENKTDQSPVYYVETGARFREFISGRSYSAKLAKKISDEGKRQPDFLAVWMWSHFFVEDLKGNEHIIIDGTPRSHLESEVLNTAFQFYGRRQPFIIHLNVSREWSKKHLLSRGRADDSEEDINVRLDWYERDVVPAIEYFRANPLYQFIEVNGEEPIQNVHDSIVSKVFSPQ